MSVPPVPCPNCGLPWPPDATVCPNCGFIRSSTASWPPPPSGFVPTPLPPVPRLVTGKAWGDVTLGLGISVLSNFLGGLGFLVMPILYFVLRPNFPVLARGIGFGILAGIALALGALVWCFAYLGRGFH
jgi:hypothetical protein